jgi:hypothetical protein
VDQKRFILEIITGQVQNPSPRSGRHVAAPGLINGLRDGSMAMPGRRCCRRRSEVGFGNAYLSQRLPLRGATLSAIDIFDSASHALPCSHRRTRRRWLGALCRASIVIELLDHDRVRIKFKLPNLGCRTGCRMVPTASRPFSVSHPGARPPLWPCPPRGGTAVR